MNAGRAAARRRWLLGAAALAGAGSTAQGGRLEATDLDLRVRRFLEERRHSWNQGINYWNVRFEDGQALHELVVARGFRRLLEIGTSTGHSAIWLGWAAARSGGRLVTLEIDPVRHEEAKRNFHLAGVAPYVDARLGDAHALVATLAGPFDFVFQDADKEGYLRYWNALRDRIAPGGCYAADNVLRPAAPEVARFVEAARRDAAFTTVIEDRGSGEGVLLACRRSRDRPS